MSMNKALTIAGSDSSGGAGLQADLKTFQERDVFGMSSLTVIVSMDENWGHHVYPVALDIIDAQMETVFGQIGVDALKTGMLFVPEIIELVAAKLEKYQAKNVVIDPVLICKGGGEVLQPDTANALRDILVPKATVVTPNLFEAAALSGLPAIKTLDDMKEAAVRIQESGPQFVLIKGGKLEDDKENAVDLLYDGKNFETFRSERFDTSFTHGAGCTYSAAITAELAKGNSVLEAVKTAKEFITAAIRHSFALNEHVGPTHHGALRRFGDK